MRLAVPAVTIMEDEVRRVTRSQAYAHDAFNGGVWPDNAPRIKRFNNRLYRKQIYLRRR